VLITCQDGAGKVQRGGTAVIGTTPAKERAPSLFRQTSSRTTSGSNNWRIAGRAKDRLMKGWRSRANGSRASHSAISIGVICESSRRLRSMAR
jgi:hypothetical protein